MCVFQINAYRPAKDIPEKEISVIIPSYNNALFYKKNLDSIFSQHYSNFGIIYIDDNSNDGTLDLVLDYVKTHSLQNNYVKIIHNQTRRGALANLYDVINALNDHVIVVNIDGDDWLPHSRVLERINYYYQNPAIWMTYGSYQIFPDKKIGAYKSITPEVIIHNAFRESEWRSSHLRTFYAKLFKLIEKNDLLFEQDFFQVTWDMAFMFPMLEMAGFHSKHISEILYIYNQSNPINDFKVRLHSVLQTDRLIRNKKKYKPLVSL